MDDIATLGPFDPPRDYSFEPELQGNPRRDIPPELRQGRHARGRRAWLIGLAVSGLVCLVSSQVPIVQTWGLYFLPFGYLDWIGAALLAGALVFGVFNKFHRGPYRYVEEGTPIVARVVGLELRPTMYHNGQPNAFRYFAQVEFRDPSSGELRVAELRSNDIGAVFKDSLTCTYRVGDYVTAVYLPHNPERTLRLYGFLELRPDLGVVKRQRGLEAAGNPLMTALGVAAIFGCFFLLCWNVYAIGRYRPVAWSNALLVPGIVGAVVLGGGLLAYLAWHQRKERRAREARNRAAVAGGGAFEVASAKGGAQGWILGIVLFFGALLLGGLTCGCWALTLNAWLDDSPPRVRPVVIQQMVVKTHSGIFRQYEIKYRFTDDILAEKHEYLSTPQEMQQLAGRPVVAHQKAGFLGWPWVERIVPVQGKPGQKD
jgi:hypothetical protein